MYILTSYFQIIKPGIILGNLISTTGCFFLASQGEINFFLLFNTLLGTSFIIASASVLNNYIDRDIDKKMQRTKHRALARGLIQPKPACLYGYILLFFGIFFLFKINLLTLMIAVFGFFIYVVIYSILMKRYSIHAILVGSLSGATPPMIGYCAVTNYIDLGALILLCIFGFWQIPHSYAIAIFRYQDYQAASIPIFPIKKGIFKTKLNIIFYIFLFFVSTIILFIKQYAGYKYLTISIILNIIWLFIALQGFKSEEMNFNIVWGKKIFLFSIVMITIISLFIAVDYKKEYS
ncbi:protoheme IX farnesyltransferase [Wigglesworthia glossinidia endosymbiont of Glossina morsitans morsitans (Yale colony)]|uniref:Protoheme IX farnesyltransferase n=1 Tax=Wigglesworthia glossinidia endosymbiont of Glossina morsitans morsitans (Yale colony) TaxID=1142511 RepID=H6Q5G2_WIGGL|nr:protoheme IX farnesyltransferase [Wigglesworthia glossinidia endosymbiont of Glossina morsitans morsitans (Yale colony)]